MTLQSAENKKMKTMNEFPTGWQTWVFRFVVAVTILLVVLPTLPGFVSNLIYSFSGTAPKIYWYLSRAGGFVTLTILWVSMGLGLGITNKMTRLWPGAPTAFAMHQFTSLLGLAFSAYHALVLMGDHFVDFSLPRLVTPFSIEYKTVWIGLGQLCFYLWLVVVITFYFRQHIGQKTWRLIHYANFAVYAMGFLHGWKSGTDSRDVWAILYYGISGLSIMTLLGYRVSDVILKKKVSLPRVTLPPIREKLKTAMLSMTQLRTNLPAISLGELRTRAKGLIPKRKRTSERILEQIEASPASNLPFEPVSARKTPEGKTPIKTLEGNLQGNKVRLRIFKEPTDVMTPEVQNRNGSKEKMNTLFQKMKESLRKVPAEPVGSNHQTKRIPFSED